MSLTVPSDVIARVKTGEDISPQEFLGIIKDSLPHAWACMEALTKITQEKCFAEESLLAGSAREGQVLRACAGTAMRTTLESHFNRSFSVSWDASRLRITAEKHAHPSKLTFQELYKRTPNGMSIVDELHRGLKKGDCATHAPRHMDASLRRELLLIAGNAHARELIQKNLGMELAFQNCHDSIGKKSGIQVQAWDTFISIPAQLLNQSPEMLDC